MVVTKTRTGTEKWRDVPSHLVLSRLLSPVCISMIVHSPMLSAAIARASMIAVANIIMASSFKSIFSLCLILIACYLYILCFAHKNMYNSSIVITNVFLPLYSYTDFSKCA